NGLKKRKNLTKKLKKILRNTLNNNGSLSTVVGDEKLTSREDRIGPFFMYVQCDEDTLLKVDKVSKTEAQAFDVFD
ncbi:hypothetical protein AKL23_09725, partial [Streptococcus thermophilus]|uniref:hypothetical protein n=1 Tax=Streptococcus thermophilus TaxID=1308 RepID=UPI00069F1854